MAASTISNFPVEYEFATLSSVPKAQNLQQSGVWSISTPQIVTLSDDIIRSGSDIEGFLYVPQFVTNSTCDIATRNYYPSNVTRVGDIPPATQFNRIAFGPWTTSECVRMYLDDANLNNATAFYTYLPGQAGESFASGQPPNASDAAWNLGDGGVWKSTYQFPVYALNTLNAATLMGMVADYSGNISSAPSAQQLYNTYHFGTNATIRLYTQATIPNTSNLPSLWVFLLIVLGILLVVLVLASLIMRVVQRRRRIELQRLIASGQVNLEALGVARVKVTEEILVKMPICVYVEHGGTPGPAHAPRPESSVIDQGVPVGPEAKGGKMRQIMHREKKTSAPSTTKLPSKMEEKVVLFPQDSCVICLDDYQNHETPVKWLPCSHVFHPACIDPLLREYSSLCPICKASVLPKDYIPEVTNVMVRRERLNRRFREIERQERERANQGQPVHFGGIGRFVRLGNHDNAQQNTTTTQLPEVNVEDVEMQRIQPAATPTGPTGARPAVERSHSGISAASAARRPEGVSREDWARQRAAALVGTSETVEEAERNQEARRPIWRRALGPIFPNLR